ncbi:hypothetical protein C8T65DRAFT_699331 [Cerioporus squamosus]|nr:hypothetical protein C8T65DRAFT_699331 [Cerioporus squamosus]
MDKAKGAVPAPHHQTKTEQGEAALQDGERQDGFNADTATRIAGEKPRSRFEKLPTSIFGFRAPISTQRDSKKPRTQTAQMLIREDVSARPPASLQPSDSKPPIPPAVGFVKPAGVDEPGRPPRTTAADCRKRDREQDPSPDQPGSEGKKKQKRKEKKTSS